MAASKMTAPVRKFLTAIAAGQPARPTNPTIAAALAGGLVEYREGERVEVGGIWRTVGAGYFLTDAGRVAVAG